MTAFHCAAIGGHVAAMEFFLAQGADPIAKDRDDKTAFHFAAENGHLAAMELLLAHGADPNAKDGHGNTAFHYYAAMYGHVAAMELLLAKGVDPNAKGRYGKAVFHFAVLNGHVAAMELLLAHGADLNAKDGNGNTAFHYAATIGGCPTAVVLLALLVAGADRTAKDKAGKTAFDVAESRMSKLTSIIEAFDFYTAHNTPRHVFVFVLCAARRRPPRPADEGATAEGAAVGAPACVLQQLIASGSHFAVGLKRHIAHRRVRGGADARHAPRALQGHRERPVSTTLGGRITTHVPTPLAPERERAEVEVECEGGGGKK